MDTGNSEMNWNYLHKSRSFNHPIYITLYSLFTSLEYTREGPNMSISKYAAVILDGSEYFTYFFVFI